MKTKSMMLLVVGLLCANLCGCTIGGGTWTHIYDDVSYRLCRQVNEAHMHEQMNQRYGSLQEIQLSAAKKQ